MSIQISPVARATLALVLAVAGWPIFGWYIARMMDRSDEPLGLLALLAAIVLAPTKGWREPISTRRVCLTLLLMTLYAGGFFWLPTLARALLWILAFAVVVTPPGLLVSWCSLFVLSLPWIATLQFFLGFPLRLVITWASVAVLNALGFAVHSEATVLCWAGERVLIDAPCSGIQMAWTLAFVAAVLANVYRMRGKATFRLLRWASSLVFTANVVRAVILFLLETRFHVSEPRVHDAVGLALFSMAGAILVFVSRRVRPESRGEPVPEAPVSQRATQGLRKRFSLLATTPDRRGTRSEGRFVWFRGILRPTAYASLALVVLICGVLPWTSRAAVRGETRELAAKFPGWGGCPIPTGLSSIPLSQREARFVRGFPGRIEAFGDGRNLYVVRWVSQPTRKLHAASDCLRGAGYKITAGPAQRDLSGRIWSAFKAGRGTERLRVQERINDSEGQSWTDVSAWYWAAILQKTRGPWWSVTMISQEK